MSETNQNPSPETVNVVQPKPNSVEAIFAPPEGITVQETPSEIAELTELYQQEDWGGIIDKLFQYDSFFGGGNTIEIAGQSITEQSILESFKDTMTGPAGKWSVDKILIPALPLFWSEHNTQQQGEATTSESETGTPDTINEEVQQSELNQTTIPEPPAEKPLTGETNATVERGPEILSDDEYSHVMEPLGFNQLPDLSFRDSLVFNTIQAAFPPREQTTESRQEVLDLIEGLEEQVDRQVIDYDQFAREVQEFIDRKNAERPAAPSEESSSEDESTPSLKLDKELSLELRNACIELYATNETLNTTRNDFIRADKERVTGGNNGLIGWFKKRKRQLLEQAGIIADRSDYGETSRDLEYVRDPVIGRHIKTKEAYNQATNQVFTQLLEQVDGMLSQAFGETNIEEQDKIFVLARTVLLTGDPNLRRQLSDRHGIDLPVTYQTERTHFARLEQESIYKPNQTEQAITSIAAAGAKTLQWVSNQAYQHIVAPALEKVGASADVKSAAEGAVGRLTTGGLIQLVMGGSPVGIMARVGFTALASTGISIGMDHEKVRNMVNNMVENNPQARQIMLAEMVNEESEVNDVIDANGGDTFDVTGLYRKTFSKYEQQSRKSESLRKGLKLGATILTAGAIGGAFGGEDAVAAEPDFAPEPDIDVPDDPTPTIDPAPENIPEIDPVVENIPFTFENFEFNGANWENFESLGPEEKISFVKAYFDYFQDVNPGLELDPMQYDVLPGNIFGDTEGHYLGIGGQGSPVGNRAIPEIARDIWGSNLSGAPVEYEAYRYALAEKLKPYYDVTIEAMDAGIIPNGPVGNLLQTQGFEDWMRYMFTYNDLDGWRETITAAKNAS